MNEVAGLGDLAAKWTAFGWHVIIVEKGNDLEAIIAALQQAGSTTGKPSMILLKSEMGHGVDFMAGKAGWHGKAPKEEETAAALAQIPETLGDF